jgi:hydroxymethylbilane synthase
MKDVPYEIPKDFELGAILKRENPFDAFVSNEVFLDGKQHGSNR